MNLIKRCGPFYFPCRQSEHERYLAGEVFKKPVFVTDYPKGQKAFYMYQNDDVETVAATDLLFPKLGEIVGASQREHRLEKLLRRIEECGLREEDDALYYRCGEHQRCGGLTENAGKHFILKRNRGRGSSYGGL